MKDRFTLDMLEDYLQHLGILVFDASFYLPPNSPSARLVEKKGPMVGVSRTLSLEEARNYYRDMIRSRQQ